jgi:catechol 2,3-dioxygenase-like lactoylglutathione lyase family enzyme
MAVTAMNHFTVLTDDVEATVRFYRDVVGLAQGARPPLGFPGAWLYTGNQAVLHIVGGRQRSELRAGVIDHMAFSATGLSAAIATLDAKGIAHQCRQQVGSGVWQVFFHDPNGAKVELDFAPEEPAPQ